MYLSRSPDKKKKKKKKKKCGLVVSQGCKPPNQSKQSICLDLVPCPTAVDFQENRFHPTSYQVLGERHDSSFSGLPLTANPGCSVEHTTTKETYVYIYIIIYTHSVHSSKYTYMTFVCIYIYIDIYMFIQYPGFALGVVESILEIPLSRFYFSVLWVGARRL